MLKLPGVRTQAKPDKGSGWLGGTRSRSFKATLIVVAIVVGLGFLYSFYVTRRLDETRARRFRLLGSGADRLERVLALTRENVNNLRHDLDALPGFLKQQPYLELARDEEPEALVRRLIVGPESSVVFRAEGARLWVGIDRASGTLPVRLDEQIEILGRLQPGATTRLVFDGGVFRLWGLTEALEIEIVLPEAGRLELGPEVLGSLDRQKMRRAEPAAAGAAASYEVVLDTDQQPKRRALALELDLPTSGSESFELASRLPVGPCGQAGSETRAEASGPSACFEGSELRLRGATRLVEVELRLSPRQARALPRDESRVALSLEQDECGLWMFEDGAPSRRLGETGSRDWTPRPARLDDGDLVVAGLEMADLPELGFWQRRNLREATNPRAAYYCPVRLTAASRPKSPVDLEPAQVAALRPLLVPATRGDARLEAALDQLEIEAGEGWDRRLLRARVIAEAELVVPLPSTAPPLETAEAVVLEPSPREGEAGYAPEGPTSATGRARLRVVEALDPVTRLPVDASLEEDRILAALLRPEIGNAALELRRSPVGELLLAARGTRELRPLAVRAVGNFDLERAAADQSGLVAHAGEDGPRLELTPRTNGQATERLEFEVDLESMVASPILDAAFSSYLLADADGEVYFQRWPRPPLEIRGRSRIRPRSGLRVKQLEVVAASAEDDGDADGGEEADAVRDGAAGSAVGLADLDLEMLCQPLRLDTESADSAVWQLCGLVDGRENLKQALGVSPYLTGGLGLLFLLGVLSLPILRFLFMERRERLRRRQVMVLLAGTWLTLVTLTLLLSALHAHLDVERKLEAQLVRLSNEVEQRLRQDLGELRGLLTALDAQVARAFEGTGRNRGEEAPGCGWAERMPEATRILHGGGGALLLDVAPAWREAGRPLFESVFWTDGRARQIAKATVGRQNTPPVTLSDRAYIRAVQQGRLWEESLAEDPGTGGGRKRFFFETFLSITTAERSAALSVESDIRRDACGGVAPYAAVITGLPPSLRAPLVSPPLGFAIVDSSARVLFHSEASNALTTTLLEDLEQPDRLVAALISRQPVEMETLYLNRPHHFSVRPLFDASRDPGRLPQWWIVSFFDKELPRTAVTEAVLRSLLPITLYGLLVGGLLLALRKGIELHLWPTRRKNERHMVLMLVYGLVLLGMSQALSVPALLQSPVGLFTVYALLPLACLYGSTWYLSRERRKTEGDAATSPGGASPSKTRTDGRLARSVAQVRDISVHEVFSDRDSIPFVAGTIMLWILLAVLPTVAFFGGAWTAELGVLARHDAMSTLEGLAHRREETRRHLERLDLADAQTLDRVLTRPQDQYLFSAAAELAAQHGFEEGPVPEDRRPAWVRGPMLAYLHRLPIYNRSAQSLRYLESDDESRPHWSFNASSQGLVLDPGPAARHYRVTGASFSFGAEPGHDPAHVWLRVLLLLILTGALALWIFYVSRHLCFSRARTDRGTSCEAFQARLKKALASGKPPLGFILVLTAPQHFKACEGMGDTVFLSRRRGWKDGMQEALESDEPIVVCKDFEKGLDNAALRADKLDRLRTLLNEKKKTVLLVGPRSPYDVLRPAFPGANVPGTPECSFQLSEAEAASWTGNLRRLEKVVLEVPPGEDRGEDYWNWWWNCLDQERLALLQLAEEQFLNPQQIGVVESLIARGLLKLDRRLEFTDKGFEEFVRKKGKSHQLASMERAAHASGWGSYRRVFGFALLAIVLFLFWTRRDLFDTALALLAAVGATLPALFNLFGSAKVGATPTDAGGG